MSSFVMSSHAEFPALLNLYVLPSWNITHCNPTGSLVPPPVKVAPGDKN